MVYNTRNLLLILSLLFVGTLGNGSGWASCFGNYPSILSPNSVVASGLGSFIAGEDWTYTTALCSDWAQSMAGACVQVQCVQGGAGASGGMNCVANAKPTYVRVIDQLGNNCGGSPIHVFDLSNIPFNQLGYDGASCSGKFAVNYSPISCQTAGLVSGGIKIGIPPGQVDPWCPSFVFSNVGGSGVLSSVSVSSNGGTTWNAFKRNSANGARWDCQSGSGTYLGKSLSFKFTGCSIAGIFTSCTPGDSITVTNVLPSGWCGNSGVPCAMTSFQAPTNIGSGSSQPPPPQTPPPQTPPPPPPPGATDSKIRCGSTWPIANGKCGTKCVDNSNCASGESCFADLDITPCSSSPPPPPPVTQPTNSPVRCGVDWGTANSDCFGKKCVGDADCSTGTKCFADLTICSGAAALADDSTQPSLLNMGLTPAQIGGIVVASVVLVAIIVAAFFLLRKRAVEEIV